MHWPSVQDCEIGTFMVLWQKNEKWIPLLRSTVNKRFYLLNLAHNAILHINCSHVLIFCVTFLEKMTNIVALLFVIVVSVVDRSDAVSCYNCQYVSIQPQGATCVEPFNATSAPKCNGPACEFIFQNITGQQSRPKPVAAYFVSDTGKCCI